MARLLSEEGYRVCLLDADSTNFGLHQALGIESSPASLLAFLGGPVFAGGPVTCPVDDPVTLENARIQVDQISQEYRRCNRNGVTLLIAGKLGELGPGAGCDGPVAKIARDFRAETDQQAFVTLIDFKAGMEDTARGAITTLDQIVVVVDPSVAAVQFAIDLQQTLQLLQQGARPATRHLTDRALVELVVESCRNSLR